MPFTPKFVDMVRNFTTSQGSGPVVLGAAVNGYTSLADAAAVGEQFYYCIQGVDKPQEREVGRGTRQANGTIAREPISGSATNFSSGTKTISLVAAAEWFAKVDQAGGSGGSSIAASRSALAATDPGNSRRPMLLTETGREGLFLFEAGNQSAKVAADVRQGLFVAPSSDPSGASGAWVRQYDGAANVAWWGAVADDNGVTGTDNFAAINGALDTLAAIAVGAGGAYSSAPRLQAIGRFYVSDTIDLKKCTYVIEGHGSFYESPATQFRFPAGRHGFVIDRADTLKGALDTSLIKGADFTILRNIRVLGPSSGSGDYDGICLKARALVDRCCTRGWARAGISVIANASGTGANRGNANNWQVIGGRHDYNKVAGLYVAGEDANAGWCLGADCAFNGQYGFYDASFLGNSYVGCHAEYNGTGVSGYEGTTNNPSSLCYYNGRLFTVQLGQATACSTNAPPNAALSNAYWGYCGTAGAPASQYPEWTSGLTWAEGGAYYMSGAVAGNVLIGCYVEGGQSPAKGSDATVAIGGALTGGMFGTAALLSNNQGTATFDRPLQARWKSATGLSSTKLGGAKDTHFTIANEAGDSHFLLSDSFLRIQDGSGNNVFAASGTGSGLNFGRSSAQAGVTFFSKLAIGYGGGGRIVDYGSAAPASGDHAAGEIVFNTSPVAGGSLGWVCTAGGTPGTWTAISLASGGGGGSVSDGDKGDVIVASSGASWKVESLSGSGGALDFKTGAADNGFIAFFTKASDQSARQAYLGFGGPDSLFSIVNEKAGGSFRLVAGGVEGLLVNAGGDISVFRDVVAIGGSIYTRGVFLRSPSGGGSIEFRDTSNVAVGAIAGDNGGNIKITGPTFGFGAGAGGSITQATSKSTGVTLNKACGQILMNAAALAASTSVSFTLSSDKIAASDTLIVNIGSGASANSYSVSVDAVAAGSCRIQLRNLSGGSLSEAVGLNFAVLKAVAA